MQCDALGDSNYQLAASCYALKELEFFRSPDTLRLKVVQIIEEYDMVDGMHLELFAGLS